MTHRLPASSDPIERALAADPEPALDARLAERVMRAVRHEARTPPPIALPWRRLVLGAAAVLVWCLAGFFLIRHARPAQLLALAQRGEVLALIAGGLTLLCLRFARFCVRS